MQVTRALILAGLVCMGGSGAGCHSSSDRNDAGLDAWDSDGGPDSDDDAGIDAGDPGPGDDGGSGGDDGGSGADDGGSGGDDGAAGGDDGGEADGGWPFAGMLLHTEGGSLAWPDGSPIEFRGAISCCGGDYGWPLFDPAWLDYVAAYGVDFLHVRLGPFLTGPDGESDWAPWGGGYPEVGGQADLSQFNEAFWTRVRWLIEQAGQRGMWVEVDVADGWAIKHCRWGDIPGYSAWDAAYNLQAEDWCASGGSREILGDDVHERWVRKVVAETGAYGNVIYQDGNEIGIVGGYDPTWSLSIRNIIHDEEARRGYLRHLYGTNSGHPTVLQADGIDFGELHQQSAPVPADCFSKPCLCNEYNPNPALTPAELHQRYCDARAAGTYFWYWRHGQSAEQMNQTLGLIQAGCD